MNRSRTPCGTRVPSRIINGDKMLSEMVLRELSVATLADLAGVCQQTVRNYCNSTPEHPRPAGSDAFRRVCKVLEMGSDELSIDLTQMLQERARSSRSGRPQDSQPKLAQFMKSITYEHTCEQLGYGLYQWQVACRAEWSMEAIGSGFVPATVHPDNSRRQASGLLTDDGRWIGFDSAVGAPRDRNEGFVMLPQDTNQAILSGLYIGSHNDYGRATILVASMVLRLVDGDRPE